MYPRNAHYTGGQTFHCELTKVYYSQAEQAELHGAELVATEEREKARRERKREKRRQKRQLQRTKEAQMTAQIASITLQTTPDCADMAAAAIETFIVENPLRLETSGDDSADGGQVDVPQCHVPSSGGNGSCAGRVAVKAKRAKKKSTAVSREPNESGADVASSGFSFVVDGSSGPETAFEEVIPRRKVKQLKRERCQNPPPPPPQPPSTPSDKVSPPKGSPSRKEPPSTPSAKPEATSASSSPYRRTGSEASSDRPGTPEYWDIDERHSSMDDAGVEDPGRQTAVEWLPEMMMLGDVKLQRHLVDERCESALSYMTTTIGNVALNVVSPFRPQVTTGTAAKKPRVVVSVLNKNLSEESISDLGGMAKGDRGDEKATTAMSWAATTKDDSVATWADMLKVGVLLAYCWRIVAVLSGNTLCRVCPCVAYCYSARFRLVLLFLYFRWMTL